MENKELPKTNLFHTLGLVVIAAACFGFFLVMALYGDKNTAAALPYAFAVLAGGLLAGAVLVGLGRVLQELAAIRAALEAAKEAEPDSFSGDTRG